MSAPHTHSFHRWLLPVVLLIYLQGHTASALAGEEEPESRTDKKGWYSHLLDPYRRQTVGVFVVEDPVPFREQKPSREQRPSVLKLSVAQLLQKVMEDNLEIQAARYEIDIADTDVLRALSGQAPRGTSSAQIPSGLFAGALGAGLGQTTLGGSQGSSISGRARLVAIPPLGTFDPSLTVTYSYDRTESPLNTLVVAGVPTVTTRTKAFQISYQQAFKTGTGVGFSISNINQDSSQRFLRFNPSDFTQFSFAFTQRLINGFGVSINNRLIDVARNNRLIVEESYRQRILEETSLALQRYWDHVAAEEIMRSTAKALKVARELHEDTQHKYVVGVIDYLEVLSAESEVAARARDLIVATTDLRNRELELKMSFSRKLDDVFNLRIVTRDSALTLKQRKVPAADQAVDYALLNRSELKQATQRIRNSDIVVEFTRDALKPRLSFFALYVSRGLSGDTRIPDPLGGPPIVIPGGFSDSFKQIRQSDFPEYAFGLTFSMPLRNRRAQADYRRALFERQQQKIQMQQLRNQIDREVRQATWKLQQAKGTIKAAEEAVEMAESLLEEMQVQLKLDLTTPYQVSLRNRDLFAARRTLVESRVAYHKAVNSLNEAMGSIQLNSDANLAYRINSTQKEDKQSRE